MTSGFTMMTRASEMGHGTARSYPSSRGAQLLPGHLPSASAAHLVSCLSSLLVSRVSAPNLRLPPQLLPAPSAGHPTCCTRKTGAGGRNDARNTRHPVHRTAALPAASSLWTFLSQLLRTLLAFYPQPRPFCRLFSSALNVFIFSRLKK